VRASTRLIGARPGAAPACACRRWWPSAARPPADPAPRQLPPAGLLWLGRDRGSELERGLPKADREGLCSGITGNGASRVCARATSGAACCLEDICLAGEPATTGQGRIAAPRPSSKRGIASRLVSKAICSRAKEQRCCNGCLKCPCRTGARTAAALLAASPLLGWSAETDRQAPASALGSLAERLGPVEPAIRPPPRLLAALGKLSVRGHGANRAQAAGSLADRCSRARSWSARTHAPGGLSAACYRRLGCGDRRATIHPPEPAADTHQPNSAAVQSAVAIVTVIRSKGPGVSVVLICPYLWQGPDPAAARSNRQRLAPSSIPTGARGSPPELRRSGPGP